jgi:hypothetical protein
LLASKTFDVRIALTERSIENLFLKWASVLVMAFWLTLHDESVSILATDMVHILIFRGRRLRERGHGADEGRVILLDAQRITAKRKHK